MQYNRYDLLMKNLGLLIIITFFSISAYSAECKFIPKNSAKKLNNILNKHFAFKEIAVIDSYCIKCRDSYVRPIVIDKVEMKEHSIKGYYTLNVNNEPLELANTYLNGENLAYKVGCESKFATRYLYQKLGRSTSSRR